MIIRENGCGQRENGDGNRANPNEIRRYMASSRWFVMCHVGNIPL